MEIIQTLKQPDYNLNLESSLREIERKYKVYLTVHDLRGRLHYNDGSPLLPGRNLHQHTCCMALREELPDWNNKCNKDCFVETENAANRLQRPFVKCCWKNLVELVVPIFVREQHMLSILVGTFRMTGEKIYEPELPDWLEKEYQELPELDIETMTELCDILRVIGIGMIMFKESTVVETGETGRKLQIFQFIEDNAHKNISLTDLSRKLNLSESRARHLVKNLTNRSFKSLLKAERMLRACNLLCSTALSLEEIAEAVGFMDSHYFNRSFKQFFGIPPGRYRQQNAPSPHNKHVQ